MNFFRRRMSSRVQDDLIFDLGLHKGFDAEFYLRKGFRVVGVEAVAELADLSRQRLASWGDRLTVINRALYSVPEKTVSFFMVPGKDDWGSLNKVDAEKGVETAVEIEVQTIDLMWLFDTFGVPRYIKCDMEGGDLIFREQLVADARRPTFVSIEMNDGREGEYLSRAGYASGQIVNQWMHGFKNPPQPPREGSYAEVAFTGEMSGLLGLELPPEKWGPLTAIEDTYSRWKELRAIDQELALGWLDLHAALPGAIPAAG